MANPIIETGTSPAPLRVPMYESPEAMARGELSRAWVMWFEMNKRHTVALKTAEPPAPAPFPFGMDAGEQLDEPIIIPSFVGGGLDVPKPPPEAAPVSWADFTDSKAWIFCRGNPNLTTYTLNASGLYMAGSVAWASVNDIRRNFIGVYSRGRFFPDPVTGFLKVKAYFQGFYSATDQGTSPGEAWFFGLGFAPPGDPPGIPVIGFGGRGALGHSYTQTYSVNTTGLPVVSISIANDLMADNASFTLEGVLGPIYLANSTNQIGLGFAAGTAEFYDSGSAFRTRTYNYGTDPTTAAKIGTYSGYNGGVHVMCGAFQSQNTNVGKALLAGIDLLEGRFIETV